MLLCRSSDLEWEVLVSSHHLRGRTLLTEAEVQKNFRKILTSNEITSESLDKAEGLIDQLRYESPLRHRLTEELDEIRKLRLSQ